MGVLFNKGATPAEVAAELVTYDAAIPADVDASLVAANAIPSLNGAGNTDIADVIGGKTDGHTGSSLSAIIHTIEEHAHSAQKVYPSGAAGVSVVAGAGAWTLDAYSTIVAAGAITSEFDIHWAVLGDPSANEDYELVLYYGATDIECARIPFTRTNNFLNSISVPIQTPIIVNESQIRARLMSAAGGSNVPIKIIYHTY